MNNPIGAFALNPESGALERIMRRDCSVIFSILLFTFGFFDVAYLWFSQEAFSVTRWLYPFMASVCALGGVLAFTRYFERLWWLYFIPCLMVPFAVYFEPVLACQVLAAGMLAIRLILPRGQAMLLGAAVFLLFLGSFILSQQLNVAQLVVSYWLNAVLLFALVDAFLVHFQQDVTVRRLVLFDKVFPIFLATSTLKLLADGYFAGFSAFSVLFISLFIMTLMMPLFRHRHVRLFQGFFIAVVILAILQQLLQVFFKTNTFGAARSLILGVMLLSLPVQWHVRLAFVSALALLLQTVNLDALSFSNLIWAFCGLLIVWLLLARSLHLFASYSRKEGEANEILGLSIPEWRAVSLRMIFNLSVLSLLVGGISYALLRQSLLLDGGAVSVAEWIQQSKWFWGALMGGLLLIMTLSFWLTMAWLNERRLNDALQTLQKLSALSEEHGREATEAEDSKTRFLSNMSHEMRTPLNGLLGISEILGGKHDPNMVPQFMEMLRESVDRLNVLLNDIVDAQAISRGQLTLHSAPFDLQDTLRSIGQKQAIQAHNKGLVLRIDIDTLTDSYVMGDQQRIGQIIDNLLNNAIKFTDAGVIQLKASRDVQRVEITVTDTGVGMTPDMQARVFRRFEQGDISLTRRYQGAGLGLSICRDLAVLMGGTINFTSTFGKGSTFVVTLPLKPVTPPLNATIERDVKAMRGHVLVVDDEPTNRLVLAEVFKGWGLSVTAAENGFAAMALLDDGDIDLVITDIAMPNMNGEELLQHLQQNYPALPCIAVTGNATGVEMLRLNTIGFKAVFAKPISFDDLRRAVDVALPG
jgi:signal transduction histidine kinase